MTGPRGATSSWRCAIACVLAVGSPFASAAPRAALALVAAPATRMDAGSIEALCARLSPQCSAAATKAMVASGAPAGRLYLLDGSKPWLALLDERDPSNASLARVHDFGAWRHSTPPSADGGDAPALHLYPALYPVGASGYAVAIVSAAREMYSGGGAFFDVADFVPLDGAPAPLYSGVPFACGKTVRACFSEKEYRHSPHCTDDSEGHLTIDFARAGEAPPRWLFRWQERSWPANVAKARQRSEHAAFVMPAGPREVLPGDAATRASFCGGPV
jgi:hypothetical protein